MNASKEKTIRWISGARKVVVAGYLMSNFLNANAVFICLIFMALLADSLFGLPFAFRDKFAVSTAVLYALVNLYFIYKSRAINNGFAVRLAAKKISALDDDLPNAHSFLREITLRKLHSAQLEERFIEHTAGKLDRMSVSLLWDTARLKEALKYFFTASFVLAAGFLLPYPDTRGSVSRLFRAREASEIGQFILLETADMKLPYGGDAQINLKILKDPHHAIEIVAKKHSGRPQVLRPELHDEGRIAARILNVTEEWQYFARIKDLKSEIYSIKPLAIPQIDTLAFNYNYPSYTAMPPERREDEYEIFALKGTVVGVEAVFSKPLQYASMKFKSGMVVKMERINERSFRQDISVSKDDSFFFDCVDLDGISNDAPAQISVRPREDSFPRLGILSPDADAVAALSESLAVNYEASDDFGLNRLDLKWRKKQEASFNRKTVKRYAKGILEHSGVFEWMLSEYPFLPGDVIEYSFELFDNDVVSGPKSSESRLYALEIADFNKEHELIDKELSRWRDEALELAAEQTAVMREASRLDPQNISDARKSELFNSQESVNAGMERLAGRLSRVLERMQTDPLTSSQILDEHAKMKENIDYLKNSYGSEASKRISSNSFKEAAGLQERVADELKKMALMSEDLIKYQKMKRLMESGAEMDLKAHKLLEDLEALQSMPDDEKARALSSVLEQINDLMSEVMSQIKDLPSELPEEFINQDAIKNMDFSNAMESIDALNKALARGDMASALQHARDLLEQIRSMLKAMDQASGAVDGIQMQSSINSEIMRRIAEYEQLVIEQTDVASKMRALEQKRLEKLKKYQEDALKKLAVMQKEAVSLSESVYSVLVKESRFGADIFSFRAAINAMRIVLEELESSRINRSFELMEEILMRLDGIKRTAESAKFDESMPETYRDYLRVIEIEKQVSEELKRIRDYNDIKPDAGDQNVLREYSAVEKQLASRTSKLKDDLNRISRNTAMLEPSVMDDLSDAAEYMTGASQYMDKQNIKPAHEESDRALNSLSKARESMENAMQMSSGGGGAMPRQRVFFRPGTRSGQFGSADGFVPIPDKNDYTPPKKFREEILKSFNEKFPETYKEIIEKYYKRLTE